MSQDHPRVGGEKMADIDDVFFQEGSPPRGRGKGGGGDVWAAQARITPAWAGKSWERMAGRPH